MEFNQFQQWIKHSREKVFFVVYSENKWNFSEHRKYVQTVNVFRIKQTLKWTITKRNQFLKKLKQIEGQNNFRTIINQVIIAIRKKKQQQIGVGGTFVWINIHIGSRSASERCAFLCVINDRGKGQKLLLRVICLLFSLQAFSGSVLIAPHMVPAYIFVLGCFSPVAITLA